MRQSSHRRQHMCLLARQTSLDELEQSVSSVGRRLPRGLIRHVLEPPTARLRGTHKGCAQHRRSQTSSHVIGLEMRGLVPKWLRVLLPAVVARLTDQDAMIARE